MEKDRKPLWERVGAALMSVAAVLGFFGYKTASYIQGLPPEEEIKIVEVEGGRGTKSVDDEVNDSSRSDMTSSEGAPIHGPDITGDTEQGAEMVQALVINLERKKHPEKVSNTVGTTTEPDVDNIVAVEEYPERA